MAAKKSDKRFETFQREFGRYQQLLGLTGYRVYFKKEPLSDAHANIVIDCDSMAATVTLGAVPYAGPELPKHTSKDSAKHEALHLLIGRLEWASRQRYVSEHEVGSASEEIVMKLEKLIP